MSRCDEGASSGSTSHSWAKDMTGRAPWLERLLEAGRMNCGLGVSRGERLASFVSAWHSSPIDLDALSLPGWKQCSCSSDSSPDSNLLLCEILDDLIKLQLSAIKCLTRLNRWPHRGDQAVTGAIWTFDCDASAPIRDFWYLATLSGSSPQRECSHDAMDDHVRLVR